MKEYQIRTTDSSVLPRSVYYQCIWLVKDIERLRSNVQGAQNVPIAQSVLREQAVQSMQAVRGMKVMEDTEDTEVESVELEASVCSASRERLEAIEAALALIPREYREGVLNNILYKTEFDDSAHENTWKKWKQRFIYELAVNLSYI